MNNREHQQGQLSLQVIIFSAVAVIIASGFVVLAISFLKFSVRSLNKTSAFSIAESGIEYYRWHLAHDPDDYQDGAGAPGPYVHNYYDKDGNLIGTFTLAITPPPVGSTVVTVESMGRVFADTSVQKIIKVKMGIPSYAKYAWFLNGDVNFGSGADVFGPIHSNAGIRFDGEAYNLVTSALNNYNDPDHTGANEYAVHTHRTQTDPLPPVPLPNRPDVFRAGRQLSIPAVDFPVITQSLAQIKNEAQNGGFYASSSETFGYDLVFNASSTFSLYKVTGLVSPPGGCSNGSGQAGWGTWSIQNESLFATGTLPANGKIFVEDHLWVRGQINNARVTVGSARFPVASSTMTSVVINNNLRYTNYDGSDVIGIIAQNNINVGLRSDDTLRIDAALIAQNGRVGRYSYSSQCGASSSRTRLITYGTMGTNTRPAFYYSSSNGYQAREYNYDANLLYSPPPGFPLSTDQYVQILWYEVK